MMTLVEADRMTRPILASPLFESDAELVALWAEIEALIPPGGYKLTNPFHLNQFEILSEAFEAAFLRLIEKYEALTGEDLQQLRYR